VIVQVSGPDGTRSRFICGEQDVFMMSVWIHKESIKGNSLRNYVGSIPTPKEVRATRTSGIDGAPDWG
jgi:hypothetical protein